MEVEATAADRCVDAAPSRWGPCRVVNASYRMDALPQQTRWPKYSTITLAGSWRPLYLPPLNTSAWGGEKHTGWHRKQVVGRRLLFLASFVCASLDAIYKQLLPVITLISIPLPPACSGRPQMREVHAQAACMTCHFMLLYKTRSKRKELTFKL